MADDASCSIFVTGERTTIDGAEIDLGTTESYRSTDVAGSKKPDPPTC